MSTDSVLEAVFENMAARPFLRQMRCEECGDCTEELASAIAEALLSFEGGRFLTLTGLLSKLRSFASMPRLVLSVLDLSLRACDRELKRQESADVDPEKPGVFDALNKAIREHVYYARDLLKQNRYLLFCRAAEPISQIREKYGDLADRVNASSKDVATEQIELLEDMIEDLGKAQDEDQDWTEYGKHIHQSDGKRERRLLGGGRCEDVERAATGKSGVRKLGTQVVKILSYSRSFMTVYSNKPLPKGKMIYSATVRLNSVDLPMKAVFEVHHDATKDLRAREKTKEIALAGMEAKEKNAAEMETRSFHQARWRLPELYVMECKGDGPEPTYYFRSMCRHLVEKTREFPFEAFAEMYLHDCGVEPLIMTRR